MILKTLHVDIKNNFFAKLAPTIFIYYKIYHIHRDSNTISEFKNNLSTKINQYIFLRFFETGDYFFNYEYFFDFFDLFSYFSSSICSKFVFITVFSIS